MEKKHNLGVLIVWAVAGLPGLGWASDRYFEKDGVTYRETRQVVQRPVTTTRYETRQTTVYRPQYRTELRDTYRTYQVPVTEYQWTTRMRGRWNPFTRPYLSHELVPVTRWECRSEVNQVPVTAAEWVPETRTVQVPVTTQQIAQEEVIRRVVVNGQPSRGNAVGGIAQLDGDPPRQSTGWRAAQQSVLR